MTMTQAELNVILEKHKKWLKGEPGGERANLTRANLTDAKLTDADLADADLARADLARANLARANLTRANLTYANLTDANLARANLTYANLTCANLTCANLARANLTDADLDYSCLPLWCGSLSAHFDDRHIAQIVYHAVKAGLASPNVSDDVKAELRKVIPLANRFHRVEECGRIEE